MESSQILLIDDDPRILNSVGRLLGAEGYTVVSTTSAREGISLLCQRDFDAVVTDIDLGDESGIELLRQIKEIKDDLPVILITGQPRMCSAEDLPELKAFRYFTKPLPIPEFLGAIKKGMAFSRLAGVLSDHRLESRSLQTQRSEFADALSTTYLKFQAIFDSDGEMLGKEALLRSHHPTLSTPQAMVSAAEKLNILPRLGARIRRLAITPFFEAADSVDGADPTLFINIHPRELRDLSKFMDLEQTGVAGRVCLEIAERNTIGDVEDIRRSVLALRELGYLFAVDDLGAGHSSLSSLLAIEADYVKIDMALVQGVSSSTHQRELCDRVMTLCHHAGAKTVAKGIEFAEDLECMKDMGCDLFQGFLLAKPEFIGAWGSSWDAAEGDHHAQVSSVL